MSEQEDVGAGERERYIQRVIVERRETVGEKERGEKQWDRKREERNSGIERERREREERKRGREIQRE